MPKLKERIKKLRKEKGLTQKELANELNVSRPTITCYETGKRTPDKERLLEIANFFNVSVDYLLGNEEEYKSKYIIKEKSNNYYAINEAEVQELFQRFNVHLDGEVLTEEDKQSVINFLRMLRDRDKQKQKGADKNN